MKKSIILMMLLLALSANGQRVFYKSGGTEGVILDHKQSSGIYMAAKNDRISISKEDVDLFEKCFSKSHSKYKDYKRQYLGVRKSGNDYMYIRFISPQYAKTVRWKVHDVLVADNPDVFNVWFNLGTKQLTF